MMAQKRSTSITFVQLPPWDITMPPQGIACLAGVARAKGIKVKIIDFNIELYKVASPEMRKAWDDNDYFYWQTDKMKKDLKNRLPWMLGKILECDTEWVGFSLNVSSFPIFKDIAPELKKRAHDKRIVIGGPFTAWRKFRNNLNEIKNFIDYIVVGEGERAILGILSPDGVNSVISTEGGFEAWKDNAGDYSVCVKGRGGNDPDDIPFPSYDGFDLESYKIHEHISLLGSRGCIRQCSFCSDSVMWGKPCRFRSTESVVNEIKNYIEKYHKCIFYFNDLMLNASTKFVEELSEALSSEDFRFFQYEKSVVSQWRGQIGVRKNIKPDLFKKMRESGFTVTCVGVESFSDNVLRLMNKGYTAQDAVDFLRKGKEAGVEMQINMIVGFPGETEGDFNANLKHLEKAAPYIDYVCSISTCGTPVGSLLETDPDKFDIDLSDNFMWKTRDGKNDIHVRVDRMKRLVQFLKDRKIPTMGVSETDSIESFIKEYKEPQKK